MYRSPILLTPFLADGSIDAAALGEFIARCYRDAGFSQAAIDSGAVILTGEAIKRKWPRFSSSGKDFCSYPGWCP